MTQIFWLVLSKGHLNNIEVRSNQMLTAEKHSKRKQALIDSFLSNPEVS